MPIRLKLIVVFNLFLVALAVIGAFTYWQLDRSKDEAGMIADHSLGRNEHITHVYEEVAELRLQELAYIMESSSAARSEIKESIDQSRNTIETHASELQESYRGEMLPTEFAQFRKELDSYLSLDEQMIITAGIGTQEEALAVYRTAQNRHEALAGTLHGLRHGALDDAEDHAAAARSFMSRSQYAMIAGLLAAGVLVFAFGHPSSLYISRRLRSLIEHINRVSRGELEQRLDATGSDEFAAVAEAFDNMLDSLRGARDRVDDLHTASLAMSEERVALLRERMSHVVTAQEEERQRVARELHDQAGQTLTALQLGLSEWETSAPTPELSEKVAELRQLALEAMQLIRNLSLDLRPGALDELGLAEALKEYAETFTSRTGIRTEVEIDGRPRRLAPEVEVTLFRIAQEGLTNVAKHAGAGLVQVGLEFRNPAVNMTVEDDGAGFDVERVLGERSRRSLGLFGMEERCRLLGAEFGIQSRLGKGTRLAISVPSAPGVAGVEVASPAGTT